MCPLITWWLVIHFENICNCVKYKNAQNKRFCIHFIQCMLLVVLPPLVIMQYFIIHFLHKTLKIVFLADCPFNEPHSQWWLHFVLDNCSFNDEKSIFIKKVPLKSFSVNPSFFYFFFKLSSNIFINSLIFKLAFF